MTRTQPFQPFQVSLRQYLFFPSLRVASGTEILTISEYLSRSETLKRTLKQNLFRWHSASSQSARSKWPGKKRGVSRGKSLGLGAASLFACADVGTKSWCLWISLERHLLPLFVIALYANEGNSNFCASGIKFLSKIQCRGRWNSGWSKGIG